MVKLRVKGNKGCLVAAAREGEATLSEAWDGYKGQGLESSSHLTGDHSDG